jgi:hypothetical protein
MDLTVERWAEVERHLRALGWIRPDERLLALAPAPGAPTSSAT